MFVFLFLFWLILNARITLEIVLLGAVFSAVLTFAARRVLKVSRQRELKLLRRLPRILLYLIYLVWQIILSNLAVIRLILCPGTGRPKLVWFRPALRSDLSRLALANSITLTPGTVTVGLNEDTICVYAMRPEMAEDLADGGFVKKLNRLEEETHG